MWRLISKLFNSALLRIFVKVLGSLGSALLVISGYLLFLDLNSKRKNFETEIEEIEPIDEDPPTN